MIGYDEPISNHDWLCNFYSNELAQAEITGLSSIRKCIMLSRITEKENEISDLVRNIILNRAEKLGTQTNRFHMAGLLVEKCITKIEIERIRY